MSLNLLSNITLCTYKRVSSAQLSKKRVILWRVGNKTLKSTFHTNTAFKVELDNFLTLFSVSTWKRPTTQDKMWVYSFILVYYGDKKNRWKWCQSDCIRCVGVIVPYPWHCAINIYLLTTHLSINTTKNTPRMYGRRRRTTGKYLR